ncbi:hypothetical protein LOD99_6628 [Oopsacas minuta]|uniref:Sema domain-containing protein n=1 Tax=Oopsacas minuta TaxID=111878 RepID=A0AAV7JM82_9METZ|nr:hypothetical protein LOD99_6628 [Oopsacas minuta]
MMLERISYSLFAIFIFAFFCPLIPAQQVPSTVSSSVTTLYSFTINNSDIYLGGDATVVTVTFSDLTSTSSLSVPRTTAESGCGIQSQAFCVSNVIDHIFPFSDALLACGSNGGSGGCSLFLGASTTPDNEFEIHLSGNIRPENSELSPLLTFLKNSIFLNPNNNVLYSLHDDFSSIYSSLALFNFTDFIPGSTPTASSNIPLIVETFETARSSQTETFFFNNPTPGRIFRYASAVRYDFIYIPFTERVLEQLAPSEDYTFLANSFHGRLARICTNDLGQFTTPMAIGTFSKITIDCRQALGIRYPQDSYYVSIALKEIFILDPDNIYGFFTSQNTAEEYIQSSAVCKFISDRVNTTQDHNIEKGFSSDYFSGYDLTPIVGEPPWDCSDPLARILSGTPTTLYAATIVNVLHRDIVFNEAVLALSKHFEDILIDITQVVTANGTENITLFYATTSDGYIIKMKIDTNISIVGEFEVTNGTLFNAELQDVGGVQYLFAISNDQLFKISLELCFTYETAVSCYNDPQCIWSDSNRNCIQYNMTSIRVVPADLSVDDTCQLSLMTATINSLTVSIQCEVMLTNEVPVISVISIAGITITAGNITFNRLNMTYGEIDISGLEELTGYIITVELNYTYAIVPDISLVAYTEIQLFQIGVLSSPICPSNHNDISFTFDPPTTFPTALSACATCNAIQYCSVFTSPVTFVPFVFPWDICVLTTTAYSSTCIALNSSACDIVQFNRCDNGTSTFQHLNFSFSATATTIEIVLYDGYNFTEFGITGYSFTLGATTLTGRVEFTGLSPSTMYTIDYTATTECGDSFDASRSVTTEDDWSLVNTCIFTTGGDLKFEYSISNISLCSLDVANCMTVNSTCSLMNQVHTDSDTLVYDVTLDMGSICTVSVYPTGNPDLLAYYGCTASFYQPITYSISINELNTTTNSVSFGYRILPDGQFFNGIIRLFEPGSEIAVYTLEFQPTGFGYSGFSELEQNTAYSVRIEIDGLIENRIFTTDQSLLSQQCSPIGDYTVDFTGDNYQLVVFRNNDCPLSINVTHICYVVMNDDDNITFDTASVTIPNLNPNNSIAFGLFSGDPNCPLTSPEYRYIYSDSIIQNVIIVTPTPTPTPIPTSGPPDNQELITASVFLFYTASGAAGITVLVSTGGLSLMCGLIVYYPKLLKKKEERSQTLPHDKDDDGLKNAIDDSS